jgi:PAT family beta-lactamase induction signal transducer AmpG
MALTTPLAKRGAVAGWGNAGALGGTGMGGGLGIWLTGHAGGFGVATMILAPITLLSALPLMLFRLPPRVRPPGMRQKLGELGGALATLVRSRGGVLALVVILLPACLGAAAGIFPAVAGGWRASNDLVALTAGLLAGIVVIPGAIVGGYLCDLFPRRPTYVAAAFVYAAAEAAMAFAPHTPTVFVVFLLLLAFLQGRGGGRPGPLFGLGLALAPRASGPRRGGDRGRLTHALPRIIFARCGERGRRRRRRPRPAVEL